MGDRNNPIKFGPEWLRNLARERNAGSAASNSQGAVGGAGSGGSGGAGAQPANAALSATGNTSTGAFPKVLLAKLRYGREEMLALYDRSSEAPAELIYNESLYQPRGKPPIALNNTFEDDMREPSRSGPPGPVGGVSAADRFGMGRGQGLGRGSVIEGRGRGRLPFVRQTPPAGRGAWQSNSRAAGYGGGGGGGGSGGADEDQATPQRAWTNSNGASSTPRTSEQAEWAQNKQYRTKRVGANTNWRQSREEDEWRATGDSSRPRSMQPDKWERDWGDRSNQEKPQSSSSWTSNRRTWVGGDEDNLPEWAVDNAEACGGTFDSSGAFHGYSNDDTNLPKSQEVPFPLTRSHTHGSFVRSKTSEEGSEEWWASEKAKKLSPKRFDAIEIKFKKPMASGASSSSSAGPASSTGTDNAAAQAPDRQKQTQPEEQVDAAASPNQEKAFNKKSVRFTESKTFDALMRSIDEIKLSEASNDRGNFQSVMIASNNSLRQKHQNIVPQQNYTTSDSTTASRPKQKSAILQFLQKTAERNKEAASLLQQQQKQQATEKKVVDDIMEMTLEANDREIKDMLSSLPQTSESMLSNPPVSHRRSPPSLLNQGLTASLPTSTSVMQGIQSHSVQQPLGITNSALNASLGLSLGPASDTVSRPMGIPLPGVPSPVLPGQNMPQGLMTPTGMPGFPPASGMPGRPNSNLASSLFLGQSATNTQAAPPSGDIPMPNHGNQSNMFPLHGLQHSGSQSAFGASLYGSVLQPPHTPPVAQTAQDIADQWYYEDPKKNIQGPFSSRDMFNWYQAGFFSPNLMVRRATDAMMRPLGTYGPVVPFAQLDILSSFPMPSGFDVRNQGPHESLLNPQQGINAMNMTNMNLPSDPNPIDALQFGVVGGLIRNPPFAQQQMDSLWSQPAAAPDMMWMQQGVNARNETRVNNLPMFFWDQQPSAIAPNSLRPDVITKDMKTEDEILAQLRASQHNTNASNFMNNPPMTVSPALKEETNVNMTPDLDELQKFMQEKPPVFAQQMPHSRESQLQENNLLNQTPVGFNQKLQQSIQPQESVDLKVMPKVDIEKTKEIPVTKTKPTKKTKEDKKDEIADSKSVEDDTQNLKIKKRSAEPSPIKSKKEEKVTKKELEKEKKEWVKEGFTIVKAPEKASTKENKKKVEEIKMAEETERRRKEEDRLAAEEDKKLKTLDTLKKQQEAQKQQQRQQLESAMRKAPWSAVANQTLQDTNKDGITLAEIQRLEREKKLHQMKEQQQMIQIIAQQQAAALAREQEMQAGLGWAKKKGNANMGGQSLAEIQAETRKQSVAAAALTTQAQAAALAQEEAQAAAACNAPWASSANVGGFWDTQLASCQPPEPPAVSESATPAANTKLKKKVQVMGPVKKEPSPSADFETWCLTVLSSWQGQLDVPTFVSFLKDIESPYEVKDYVKFYLGESRDSSDFARQFLERRSKLLRVGMVTPSDDLCSPAVAVNPRTTSTSDYQEVKGKGKKTKKNKMLKVDARILGFSVTAAEDRINVGDIDMA